MKKLIHIAIADDHPTLVTGLKYILNSLKGYKVTVEAYNGKDLISQITKAAIKPDICFLDISMPIMDGYEALAYIKKEWPGLKVIILSQHFNDFVIIKTFRAGANACLPKEAEVSELLTAMERIITQGYYHSESVLDNVVQLSSDNSNVLKINSKELEFLKYCCSELSYAQIAGKMEVSVRTVDGYRDHLFEKLNLKSRSALVIYAIKSGIVNMNSL